ncbi:MAG: GNAT family N-acetyltransferase [Bacteroidia bacterium]|nr:GNAT family N-acetyltransferase [Bacteroidia bacterium]
MTEKFVIKQVEPQDLKALFSLIYELAEYEKLTEFLTATEEDYKRELFEKKSVSALLFCDAAENPCGYALYYFNFSSFLGKQGLFLEDIYIRPSQRGKGLGAQVFAYLESIAREKGCGRMEWMCLDWNVNSLEFYRKKTGAEALKEWILHRKTL